MAEPSEHLKAAQAAEQDAIQLTRQSRTYSAAGLSGPAAEMLWAASAMTEVRIHQERCARLLEYAKKKTPEAEREAGESGVGEEEPLQAGVRHSV